MPSIQFRRSYHQSSAKRIFIASALLMTVIVFAGLKRVGAQVTINPLPTFAPYVSYPIGTSLNERAIVGDFDNDSNQDIATVGGHSPATATILWGDGAGNFSTQTQFAIGVFISQSLVAGDFNNDNKLDLAIPSTNEDSLYLFLGNGARGFSAPVISNAGSTPKAVTKGDFNHDNNLDVAVVGHYYQGVSILLGNGVGGFAQPIEYAHLGEEPIGLNTGEFNGDNNLDLVIVDLYSDNNVSLLYGDGDGQFSTRQDIDVGGGRSAQHDPDQAAGFECEQRGLHAI